MRRTERAAVRERLSTNRWLLVWEPRGRPGAENMAIDAELLETAHATGDAFLRLYRFDPPCLSFGRNEVTAAYDRSAIERLGIDVVRRPTGGGSVWHEHELTYAVAAPIGMFGGLRAAYRTIHERLATALRALGAHVALALHHPPSSSTALHRPCFATPVSGEIVSAGRKLVGSAQVRRGRAFLQHGSILLNGSQAIMGVISRQSSVSSRETTVSDALARAIAWNEVANVIVGTWDDALTCTALYQHLPASTDRFSNPCWTWRR